MVQELKQLFSPLNSNVKRSVKIVRCICKKIKKSFLILSAIITNDD